MIASLRHPAARPQLRFCRGCSCDDDHACEIFTPAGPIACAWVLLDIETPTGVCSSCAVKMGWDQHGLQLIGYAPPDSEPGDAELTFADFAGAQATRTLVLP